MATAPHKTATASGWSDGSDFRSPGDGGSDQSDQSDRTDLSGSPESTRRPAGSVSASQV